MTHISGYDNKFETEVLYFRGNMAVFFGYLYTRWTSESVDITR